MLSLDKPVGHQINLPILIIIKKNFLRYRNKWAGRLLNISYAHNNYYLLALFSVFTITKVI